MARVSAKKKPAKKASASRARSGGVSFIREVGGIREYRLDKNGLTILLVPDRSVPVVGFMVTYHVGSRNEAIGYTGATHLLEHLMFKGSPKFNKKNGREIWRVIEGKGAMVNASTWFDRTNYYEVLPKDALPVAIELEADRMRGAFITEQDRSDEMPVVRNEFERGENLPLEALDKQIWAIAYQAHPYHHSTIGWKSDIENVSIERLKQFYDDFYWPDNATVTVVGDFEKNRTLELIAKEFGRHPRKPSPYPKMYTEEPKQEGERRAVVRRAGTDMMGIGHKIPNAHHEDIAALLVLMTLLDGGKTSRLYRALVDTALATDISTYCYELHDPGLFITYASLTPGTAHAKAEAVIRKVYADFKTKNVTVPELSRAKRLLRTQLAQRKDGPYQFLATLNESLATGDWTHFVSVSDRIAQVSAADVRRVAQMYLVDDQATIGYFVNTAA